MTKIREVSLAEIDEIIETRKPLGSFCAVEKDFIEDNIEERYIAVDNSTGDAWVEEFKTKEGCIAWLKNI